MPQHHRLLSPLPIIALVAILTETLNIPPESPAYRLRSDARPNLLRGQHKDERECLYVSFQASGDQAPIES